MIEDLIYDIELKKIRKGKRVEFNKKKFIKPILYDEEEFHLYHNKFASQVYRIIFEQKGECKGYCYIGIKDNIVKAPYSSSFSMIYVKDKYRIKDLCQLIRGLIDCTKIIGYSRIEYTLPPEIYSRELITSLQSAFFGEGFKVKTIDINNYFNLENYLDKETYLGNLIGKARNKYKKSLKNDIIFTEVPIKDFEMVYNVIEVNRKEMAYPLRISQKQMENLLNMDSLNSKFFAVKKGDIYLASAIIFDITEDVSQVIYWGDIPKYRNTSPMAMLATEIFDVYKRLGKRYLDIGLSSENGIINTGLIDFKKSIGCDSNIKITFEYEI